VQMYFRPESVNDETSGDNDATGDETSQKQSPAQAASFRGRGLLARRIHELPTDVMGTVFIPSTRNQSKMKTGETFKEVLEWEHEWNEKRLIPASESIEMDVNSESSVQKGLALIALMQAVHDPIPIEA